MDLTPRMTESAMVARSAAAGSMVLLKNVRHTLPLLAVDGHALPIAVYGMGQLRTALTGGIQAWRTINVLDGLMDSDQVIPDGLLSHKYRNALLQNPGAGEILPAMLDIPAVAGRTQAAVIPAPPGN